MKVTPATKITLIGILAALACLYFLWARAYPWAFMSYLVILTSDILDGKEARRSGTSRLGHICDRLVRDPLLIIATLILVSKSVHFEETGRTIFRGVMIGEFILYFINISLALCRVREAKAYYYFWNYGKQSAYALLGVTLFFQVNKVEGGFFGEMIFLAAFFCLLFFRKEKIGIATLSDNQPRKESNLCYTLQ